MKEEDLDLLKKRIERIKYQNKAQSEVGNELAIMKTEIEVFFRNTLIKIQKENGLKNEA